MNLSILDINKNPACFLLFYEKRNQQQKPRQAVQQRVAPIQRGHSYRATRYPAYFTNDMRFRDKGRKPQR